MASTTQFSFSQLVFDCTLMLGRVSRFSRFFFPNGYGCSVVCHDWSYGGKQGFYELGVLSPDGNMVYDTSVTPHRNVLGGLTEDDITQAMNQISLLDPWHHHDTPAPSTTMDPKTSVGDEPYSVGDKLYTRISQILADKADKPATMRDMDMVGCVTAMILEHDNAEIDHLSNHPELLENEVVQAYDAIAAYLHQK